MSRVPVSPVHYTGASARPVFIQPSQFSGGSNSGGFTCLCCTICPCIHLGFLRTVPGLLKIIELILCSICQSLLLRYGVSVSSTIGSSFTIFLTTVSSCLLLVALLLFCYVISQNSFSLIRSSVLEVVFNVVACFLYLSSAAHLSWAVQIHVLPNYLLIPGYAAYPAMTACYVLCWALFTGLTLILLTNNSKEDRSQTAQLFKQMTLKIMRDTEGKIFIEYLHQ